MMPICQHESKPLKMIQPFTYCKVFVLEKQFEIHKKTSAVGHPIISTTAKPWKQSQSSNHRKRVIQIIVYLPIRQSTMQTLKIIFL